MLEHTYGSLEKSPRTLVGKIVEKEGGSMTEELRKRLRYLQHLPVTCQFEVAEIQLKPPIITKETLDHFKGRCIRQKSIAPLRSFIKQQSYSRLLLQVRLEASILLLPAIPVYFCCYLNKIVSLCNSSVH